MIWYLLYPFRGTSRPPRLSVDHPIRRAFYRHGILTAQHWLAAMLISCAIAAMLAYPTVFLSGNPTAGFTSKPHQIWAAARPLSDRDGQHVDIEMRQLWVHGTYMKALQKDVLQQALVMQKQLVGDEDLASIYPSSNSTPVGWGFHSPLMYWNNSAAMISNDDDIVKTVNDRSRSSSSLDISLRPASVFAGKSFARGKLVAADALVLTLMNRQEDYFGSKWQREMHSLGDSVCLDCQLYPPRGQISQSWLYEFTLHPVTFEENAFLAFAYSLMVLYVLISLRRLKAFHSRFGLVVTAITQMIMSILASFTICGILKVNLVAVPQNAYPFMLLVIGLENMFRLINAILAYPATMATDLRIANALGDVGPLSVATAAQNLLVLWLLSFVVSPGIVAFCSFAAVATLVDTFFLLTFFVAVLNVDIRRLELQDSISKSKEAAQRQKSPAPTKSWLGALINGGMPLSTRMAGSVVTTTFILTLNYHFFDRSDRRIALRRWLGYGSGDNSLTEFDAITSPPMNATLTPGEWVRMQDFDTACEVLRLVNSGAQSFVIRVFAPLVVVLSGSDRTGMPSSSESWKQDLLAITRYHLYPFAVVVVFSVTFVWVLMNFLLWNDAPEISEEIPERVEDSLSVHSIKTRHKLDIVKIACNRKGDVITAALDRTISIASIDPNTGTTTLETLPTDIASLISWPVRHLAIDVTGSWIALQHGNHDIIIYNRKEGSVIGFLATPDDHPIIHFDFVNLGERSGENTCFVIMTGLGQTVIHSLHDRQVSISKTPVQWLVVASSVHVDTRGAKLVVVTRSGELHSVVLSHNQSDHETRLIGRVTTDSDRLENAHISTITLVDEVYFVVRTPGHIHIANAAKILLARAVKGFGPIVPGPTRLCETCGGLAVAGMGTFDFQPASSTAVLYSFGYQSTHGEQAMCIHSSSEHCVSFKNALESEHVVESAGFFDALPANGILGLRRRLHKQSESSLSTLRRRRDVLRSKTAASSAEDVWEAYSLSLDGELEMVTFSATMPSVEEDNDPDLYVTTAGPGAVIDESSVAIAFGNVIKILRVAKPNGQVAHGTSRSASLTRKRGGPRKT